MDFRQMSSMLSAKVQQQIIEEHKREMEDLSSLLDRGYLQTLWPSLTGEECSVIRFFLSDIGSDLLTYRQIEQGPLPIPKAAFRKGLTLLRRKGLIFTLRRLWGELAYVMPEELISAIRNMLVSYDSSWESNRNIPSSSFPLITNGIYQVLHFIRNHSIELNKKGTLQKKDLRMICTLLGLSKEKLSIFKPLEHIIYPYENHEALILDWLSRLQLIEQSNNKLCLGEIERFFFLSTWEGHVEFLSLLREYLSLPHRLVFLYDIMVHLPAGKTYSLQNMTRHMVEYVPTMTDAVEKILVPLAELGLLRYSMECDEVVWAWNFHPPLEICPVYVQPNFEILVPKFASFDLLWSIGEFADLQVQEEMWIFSLSRESLRRAMDRGVSIQCILEELSRRASMPIPQNVEDMIRQWGKEHQRIQFSVMRVMEIHDVELAEQLVKIPAVSAHFIQRLGERFFAVREDTWNELIHELEKRGYNPGLALPTEQEGSLAKEPLKIFKDGHKLEFKVESVFPDLADAIPGIRDIPRMWSANFQPYHASTLRDLLQKAITMGLEIKVQYENKVSLINPHSLLNKEGNWMVQGTGSSNRVHELFLDDIQKVQVLLP